MLKDLYNQKSIIYISAIILALHENSPNTQFILVCIFPYLDQQKLRARTLFMQSLSRFQWVLFKLYLF